MLANKALERIQSILGELADLDESPVEQTHPTIPSKKSRCETYVDSKQLVSTTSINQACQPQKDPSAPTKILDISKTNVKGRFLPRKPRSIIFAPLTTSSFASSTFLTTSLDGSLQVWSTKDQTVLKTVHFSNTQAIAEDVCWGNGNEERNLLVVALNEFGPNVGAASSNSGDLSPVAKSRLAVMSWNFSDDLDCSSPSLLDPSPHTKEVSVIAPLTTKNDHFCSIVTGSHDKSIYLWSLEGESQNLTSRATLIHRRHTSAVNGICQPTSNHLWSGGYDSRLVGWDLTKGSVIHEFKMDHRISHLLPKPTMTSSCMLVTLQSSKEQLRLIDLRSPTAAGLVFGWQEASNTSRYLRPSWHPSGNIVACGTSSPTASPSGVNLWDVRYIGKSSCHNYPLQVIECAGCSDKRYLRSEFSNAEPLLVALSTDGSVLFVESQ